MHGPELLKAPGLNNRAKADIQMTQATCVPCENHMRNASISTVRRRKGQGLTPAVNTKRFDDTANTYKSAS
jgi:hypothetical protein